MRLLPDQIHVSVVERQPVAFTRQGNRSAWWTPTGFFSHAGGHDGPAHYSFPVVTGIDARDPLSARKARMAVYQRCLSTWTPAARSSPRRYRRSI